MQKAFCSVVNSNSGLYNSIKTSGKVNSKEIKKMKSWIHGTNFGQTPRRVWG